MDDAQTKSDQADADFAAATDDYTAKLDDWNNYEDLLNRATSTQADAQKQRVIQLPRPPRMLRMPMTRLTPGLTLLLIW